VKRAAIASAAAGVTIENKTAGEGLFAVADADRLSQAVDHLLRGAIKTSEKGARILVRAAISAKGAREIAVRDHGRGLDADSLKKALSAFDEVHRGLDRSFAGPDIGLAIAKVFVEMQGGEFDIKSKLGEGTVVRILLPRADAAEPPAEDPVAALRRIA
jgi:signal transduction histidine kinase